MGTKIALSGQLGSDTSHPVDDAVMRAKRDGLNGLADQTKAIGQCPQGGLGPPAQVMGRRVENEIWDLGYRRGPAGTAMQSRPPGATQRTRSRAKPSGSATCSMTWNAQTTSYSAGCSAACCAIVSLRMSSPSAAEREIQVETDIDRLRQMPRQPAFAAADIEDLSRGRTSSAIRLNSPLARPGAVNSR